VITTATTAAKRAASAAAARAGPLVGDRRTKECSVRRAAAPGPASSPLAG
jgi:hypothetical protein